MARSKREKSETVPRLVGLARRARGVFVGSRETRGALRRGEVKLVLVAADGSSRDRARLVRVSEEAGVPVRVVADRKELGSWIGTGPVAVVGIRNAQLAAGVRAALDASEGAARREARLTADEPRAPREPESGESE